MASPMTAVVLNSKQYENEREQAKYCSLITLSLSLFLSDCFLDSMDDNITCTTTTIAKRRRRRKRTRTMTILGCLMIETLILGHCFHSHSSNNFIELQINFSSLHFFCLFRANVLWKQI